MQNKIDVPVPYSPVRGAWKSGSHGVIGVLAYVLGALVPGIPVDHREQVTGLLFVGFEFIRNLLKQKRPSLFFWL